MEQTTVDETTASKMPVFLKVICIISFVGVGLSIIGEIMNYFTYTTLAAGGDLFGGLGNGEMAGAMSTMMDELNLDYGAMATAAIIQALLNIPILIGVIMMWKRKKVGYFIYAPFELAQPLVPVIMGLGLVGGAMALFSLVIPIAFIIMYGLNLKHMK